MLLALIHDNQSGKKYGQTMKWTNNEMDKQ